MKPGAYIGGDALDLFLQRGQQAQAAADAALARRTDPETSHAAAGSMREERHRQADAIVECLRRAATPLNHWQIDQALGWPHPTAARRLAELRRAGRIQERGTSRTGTGREATAYIA